MAKIDKLFCSVALVIFVSTSTFGQGALVPPGPPGPTMKTLGQVEPRIPIGSITNLINVSGSYYFTTNVTVASGNGFLIDANNVTIDLNGFTLKGGGVPSNHAIFVNGVRTNIVIRNGMIQGWGGSGVSADNGRGGSFENLIITDNGGVGLGVGRNSLVLNCVVNNNSQGGISAAASAVIRNCTANANGSYGLYVGTDSIVEGCRVAGSASDGIHALNNNLISDCLSVSNNIYGINLGGYGNRLDNNMVLDNSRGIGAVNSTNVIVRNTSSRNANGNFIISGNQIMGPIVVSPATMTNHPWANFGF